MYMGEDGVKIFYGIPTVIERLKYAKALAKQIGLSEDHIFVDTERNGCLWNKMRIYDMVPEGYTHVCINDDDAIVCEDYKEIVQKCVEKFPNSILTFYDSEITRSATPFVRRPNCIVAGSGFVLPTRLLNRYRAFYAKRLAPLGFKWEESVTKMFAILNDIEVILIVPNLVTVRKGLVTTARKGKWIQPQSASWVSRFPIEALETDKVEISMRGGLFNMHLPKGCKLEREILNKWEQVKNESSI